jgi:predicted Ser/Thr protein kinase
VTCTACGHPNAGAQRFCGHCGAGLAGRGVATVTSPQPAAVQTLRSDQPSSDAGGFLPGMMLAGRYRVIGLLGRGGMGEVYRADDLKLGQPVALKFLPREVERDEGRRERFLTEVRLSLRVTHPNVCRVFDIGDVDGRQFLSMEYVDGEDLASLLRRIGRLPEDKAIEIARQLCAGLSAAHEEGVLHRDLKPANVMIDGRGRAKITDFGLAGATTGISGAEARAGTPQYMAPEQVAGQELSEQTDLYALGLVLYEVFTGKRAYEAKTIDELVRLQSSTPTSPGALVSGLDPLVERAILRCLDPEPTRRPRSASSLAAALPGGDPLAMAIAAGETPSPEMVARAGGKGALSPAVAAAYLLVVLAGLAAVWLVIGPTTLHQYVPLPKPPSELIVAARAAIAAAGYSESLASRAHGFASDGDYFARVLREDQSVTRWNNLGAVTPPPVWFWYRESPRALSPTKLLGVVNQTDPPMLLPGMIRVRLDPSGRLVQLRAVPPDRVETKEPAAEPDWTKLFAVAGLNPAEFASAASVWSPPHASDVRRAWTKGDLRVEAASFNGRPVWFAIVPHWRRSESEVPAAPPGPDRILQVLEIVAIIGGALLARRNLRLDRSDRRGAFRFAATYLLIGAALVLVELSGAWSVRFRIFRNNLGLQLIDAALVWMYYIALEPYVRRLWPNTLIAWSRVLEGRFRDPLVGQHILLGAVAGMVATAIFAVPELLAPMFGVPPPAPEPVLYALGGAGRAARGYFQALQDSFFIPVSLLLIVLLARVLLRPWLAYVVLVAIVIVVALLSSASMVELSVALATLTLATLILVRLGLLAFLVTIVFSSWGRFPLTTDPDSWFFPGSVVTMLIFAGVAIYAFVVSVGDQSLFKGSILDDGAASTSAR